MDMNDFFDINKPLRQVKIDTGEVGSIFETDLAPSTEYEEEKIDYATNFDYAEKFRQREMRLYLETNSRNAQVNDLNDPDFSTACPEIEVDQDLVDTIYNKYNFNNKPNEPCLSISTHQEQIIETICANPVTIIQGPTGCGKTTQVPQFILNHCKAQNKYCNIAITQPRRIAAISVAKRVAEERGWSLGTVVGYHVGMDAKVSEDTLLTYMTTGVLLQKLITKKNMNQYTHVIIDEVHEREAEMDFLLFVVRRYVQVVSPHVKVVLMSATFNVNEFADYFAIPCQEKLVTSPIISIGKSQPHVVSIYYLNQFTELLSESEMPDFKWEEPCVYSPLHDVVIKLLRIFNNFDRQTSNIGSVLIFLPGIYEIELLYEDLKSVQNKGPIDWYVVPLHSSITVEEQRKAFDKPPDKTRKIILATNIAESSITVPDVIYVIDFCLTKVLMCDAQNNYTSLKLMWASHTNCVQRSGRVGRVASGRVYRLVPEMFYHKMMTPAIKPEMLRSPLHRLVLLSKMLELDVSPIGILGLVIDPPPLHNIEKTVKLLKEAGALLPTTKGEYITNDGDLTYLGRIMAQLPVDINVSKLIVLGHMFSTLKECIIMAAAMSLQNIFSSPFKERMKAYSSKLYWADCSSSDLIAYLHVYVVWENNKYNNLYRVTNAEMSWMRRNFLQPRIMREWRILVTELRQRLNHLGIAEPMRGRAVNLSEHEKAMMLKVVISGAFYPNYFVRSCEGGQVDEGMAVRTLGGRDPYTTIYFTGKSENQPTRLYVQSIKKLLEDCGSNMHVSYEMSSKVYVQFKPDFVPKQNNTNSAVVSGKIAVEVYNAVKRRHLRLPNIIPCLSPEESKYRLKQLEVQLERKHPNEEVPIKTVLPNMETQIITIQVSFINNPSHFYVHNVEDKQVMHVLNKIEADLNSLEKALEPVIGQIEVGQIYAAPYEGKYYRASVLRLLPQGNSEPLIQVLFIDYGNMNAVQRKDMRKLLPIMYVIPPLALECTLTGIQPSVNMNAHALWSQEATSDFSKLTENNVLYGKVYSIVNAVVSLELYQRKSAVLNLNSETLNQWMINKGYAQNTIESFLSQDDHKRREYVQNMRDPSEIVCEQQIEWLDKSNEIPAPNPIECNFKMSLNGPFSPLEMKIFSIIQCSASFSVSVEGESVNSVLLDSDPQDPHDQLLVAGSVSQVPDAQRLKLRHTTVMPNIHGFPVLMSLIFCPTMELQANKEGTRFVSILCGVGYDSETKLSLFPAHDLALNLDFVLSENDVTKINEIRYYMNQGLHTMSCFRADTQPLLSIETCQNEIRACVRTLLQTPRASIERGVNAHKFTWGQNPSHLEIFAPTYEDPNDIWPMHSTIKLLDDSKVGIHQHLEKLKDVATKTVSVTEITCNLCSIVLYDATEVRLHLISRVHQDNIRTFQ